MTSTFVLRDALLVVFTGAIVLSVWFIRTLARARNALARAQEELNLTIRAAQLGLWSWNIPANEITADENNSVLFGLPLGEFPRTVEGFARLVHEDDRERVQRQVGTAVEHGTDYETEFRVVWPAGTVRSLAVRAKIFDRGKPTHRLTGVCWDVTERRRGEEDLRAANAKLTLSLESLERRKNESLVLSEMADLLQACSSSAEAGDLVARFCAHLFSGCGGALYTYSASRNLVNLVASWNNPVTTETAFEPDDCWALRQGHPHFSDPGRFATPCRHLQALQHDGHACFPLMAQGTGLGIIYLQSRPRPEGPAPVFLDAEERQLAITVAEQVALSLANLALREALRLQTIRDPLTGLFNRRYLEESVDRELHRSARRGQSASLLMMDLDHFKAFNDTFGHEGGDALLRAFGQFLREHLRREDIACRYGGEEFCVLFCESSLADAMGRAEQLCSEIKRLVVHLGGRPLGVVTISIGVAVHPLHGSTILELVAAADSALYRAKAEGRDRAVSASAQSDVTPAA